MGKWERVRELPQPSAERGKGLAETAQGRQAWRVGEAETPQYYAEGGPRHWACWETERRTGRRKDLGKSINEVAANSGGTGEESPWVERRPKDRLLDFAESQKDGGKLEKEGAGVRGGCGQRAPGVRNPRVQKSRPSKDKSRLWPETKCPSEEDG